MIDLADEFLAADDTAEPVRTTTPTITAGPSSTGQSLRQPEIRQPRRSARSFEVDRPYGERGNFEKVTVTLPSEVGALLLDESNQRKKRRSADWPIAAIVREALAAHLAKKGI